MHEISIPKSILENVLIKHKALLSCCTVNG